MQTILVDASRFHHQEPTGVEIYSDHVIGELIVHAKVQNVELVLLTQKDLGFPRHERDVPKTGVTQEVIAPSSLWTLKKLTSFFWKRRGVYDVLFVPSHILPLYLPKKSVVTIHDVAHRHHPESYSRKQWWILELSTRFAVKFATKIVVVSEATKRDLIKLYHCPSEKIQVMYLGFDKEQFLSSFQEKYEVLNTYGLQEKRYLQFVGRIEEKKNTPLLVEAFLKAKIPPEWKLVLVGKNGEGSQKVEKLLEGDMQGRVVRTGFQSNDVAYSLLKHAGGFIFPSKFEGFGLPILEAYALGVPVLCSDGGALLEVAGEGAQFIKNQGEGTAYPSTGSGDISLEDLTYSIEVFVENIQSGSMSPQKGYEQLKKFSWKQVGEEMWNLLRTI